MTTILAIDTSTGPCSAAIWHEGAMVAYVENSKPVMQSASLIPMIEEALAKSGLSYKELTLVAATVGPGSFTGIRVGLAAAQGIAYAAGIPTAGFTTFEVLAFAAGQQAGPVLSVLNAGKGEYYYQPFDGIRPLSEPLVGAPAAAASALPRPAITCGNVTIDGIASHATTFPRADALAQLAASGTMAAQPLSPFYIRPPDAKLPKQA